MAITIQAIKARQIFDSRGNPTVEVDVTTSDGTCYRAAVPSGASTGIYEALELRDGGSDYLGKGVSKAVENVNAIIGPALIGKDPTDQVGIDNFMVQQLDGTVNEWGWCKQKLGANAILAVSLAVCKAGAGVNKIPLYKHIANLAGNNKLVLPVPAFNVINGGSHAGNKLAMQEFMILPVGASSFKEAMKMGVEVYHNLKSVIKKKYGQDATNVGDEGGFAPNIQENKEGLELLKTAIAKAGYTSEVVIGMDVAASEFYGEDKRYDLNFKEEKNDGSQKIPGDALKDLYKSFVSEYPIVSIEDPFDQDDWEHYGKMTSEVGEKVQIVGDDLLVTNPKLLHIEEELGSEACREEELRSFTAFHNPFVFLISLLASLVGLHFQVLGISPLKRHFTIILLLIMATVVYSNAYMRINLRPHNKEYLPIFRCICLISGIIACELLLAMIISHFWLFIINLSTILIVEILHLWYQQIYKYLYQTASVIYNAVRGLFQQIFQSIRLAASHVVSLTRRSTEQEDVDQTAGNVQVIRSCSRGI